jgi:CRP-like cAMP-binding protein
LDLTLESALSAEGMLGHLAYVFLVASMVMRRMLWLRLLALAAFVTGISYSALVLHDPVGTFWESLLAAINLVQLALIAAENRRARFLPQERALVEGLFPGFSRRVQRQVLNLGRWQTLAAGEVLATEGQPVAALSYLAEGRARVLVGGAVVAERGPGALIGELTVASGAPAHGTVTLSTAALVWQAGAEDIRRVLATRPEQAAAFQSAFFRAVSAKLTEAPG